MKSVLFLAWRHLAANRLKTAVMVAAISITLFLPIAVHLLVRAYNQQLGARAARTPLVLGTPGNRYDLVLKTLTFRPGRIDPVKAGVVDEIAATGTAEALPVHSRFTARGYPLVGTSHEYFGFRGLVCDEGRLPAILGEAVLGARVARELGLGPGDTIDSDQRNIYDISRAVPIRARVTGVLASSRSADDDAVFVDVKTAWVVEGLGHGHTDLTEKSASGLVLERGDSHVKANAAVETFVEITPENVDSFHFHGGRDDFPLTSVIIVPRDEKARVILKARYDARPDTQCLSPADVVDELMGIVFRVTAFFDLNFALVAISTALFLGLVVVLSARIRRREFETLHRMGGARGLVFRLQVAELAIVAAASLVVACALALALLALAPRLFEIV